MQRLFLLLACVAFLTAACMAAWHETFAGVVCVFDGLASIIFASDRRESAWKVEE